MPMYDINSKMLDMQITTSLEKEYYVIKSIYQKENDIVEICIANKEDKPTLYLLEANSDMLRNTSYAITHANLKLNDDLEVVQEPVTKIPDLYVIDKTNNYNKFRDSSTEMLIIRKINGNPLHQISNSQVYAMHI